MTDLDRSHGSTELCTTPTDLPAATRDRAPGMHWSVRADKRIAWVGWHAVELTIVLTPAVFAWMTGQPTALLLSVLAAGLWGGHEHRKRRRRDKSASTRPAALTPEQADGTHTASSDKEATRGQLA